MDLSGQTILEFTLFQVRADGPLINFPTEENT